MRNILYVFILFSMFLTSCNSPELEDSIVDNDAVNSKLLNELSVFNDSILNAKSQTRSIIRPMAWRRAQIIAADCGGAYSGGKAGAWAGSFFGPQGAGAGAVLGALLGGVCGSYVAYESSRSGTRAISCQPLLLEAREKTICAYATMINEEKVVSDYSPKEVKVNYPIINDNVTLMGAKHNIILEKLINGDKLEKDITKQLTVKQQQIINSQAFSESFDEAMDNIYKNIKTGDGMTSNGSDLSTRLMNMFYDILIKYPESLNDVEFIINKYVEAIKSSPEISENDKELIYSGLSVAASSSEFWNENY